MRVVEKVFASLVLLRDKTLRVWEVRWGRRKDVGWLCYEMRWGLVCWISGWAASQRHWPGTKHMNVVLNLGMGCVRGAIDRDWAHQYLISAPFPITHSFPRFPGVPWHACVGIGHRSLPAGKYTVDISTLHLLRHFKRTVGKVKQMKSVFFCFCGQTWCQQS